jgi:hypothetical protein
MPENLYHRYAAKICRRLDLPAASYSGEELTSAVMKLPIGEANAAFEGKQLGKLPRLGDTVSVREHMQSNFFDVIGMSEEPATRFTSPVLVKRSHLERLEGWHEWQTLAGVLRDHDLEPVMVFRNTPIPIKTSPYEETEYYVADVRVTFRREDPFRWSG